MAFGVTSTGFNAETQAQVLADIQASLQTSLGSGINLIAPSVFSQIAAIMANREATLWQAMSAVYASQYPSTAFGQSLDNVCSITGIVRKQATAGTVTLQVNLNAGVTLPAGQLVSAGAGTAQWKTTASATNGGGSPANVNVAAACTVTGPISALASTLTTIVTPFTGWNSVTNPSAALPGTSLETDAALRLRRKTSLNSGGAGTQAAITAALLAIPGVAQANVFINNSNATDGNGVPAGAIECVVEKTSVNPATDAAIRAVIWAQIAAGIQPFGHNTGTIVDSQGFTQEVDYSNPTNVTIYVKVNGLHYNANYGGGSQSVGDAAVAAAIAAYVSALPVGSTIVDSLLNAVIFGVGGVVDVPAGAILIGTSNPPTTSTNVALTSRQQPVTLSANVTVVSTTP